MEPGSMETNNPRPALPIELHATTREKHRSLNLQILAKLPLCLPPTTDSPYLYTKGMVVFGQIYFAFEHYLSAFLAGIEVDERIRDLCRLIYFPRLLRSARLQRDIEALKLRLGDGISREISDLAENSKCFYQRIVASLSSKPHVLLAYAWTMYLALFNGGRWIQRELASAGSSFWIGGEPPLSFWNFEDEWGRISKGEDLKVAFKEGLTIASASLSDEEKDDVIEETRKLFDLCSEMVACLDGKAASVVVADSSPVPLSATVTPSSADSQTNTPAAVTPVWGYVVSTLASVKTSAGTVWRRKQLSSD